MDWSADVELSVLNLFDPLKQPDLERNLSFDSNEILSNTYHSTTSNANKPSSLITSATSPLTLTPIKLRLKLTTCSEFKLFNQFVEQIRNHGQSEQVKLFRILLLTELACYLLESFCFQFHSMKFPLLINLSCNKRCKSLWKNVESHS